MIQQLLLGSSRVVALTCFRRHKWQWLEERHQPRARSQALHNCHESKNMLQNLLIPVVFSLNLALLWQLKWALSLCSVVFYHSALLFLLLVSWLWLASAAVGTRLPPDMAWSCSQHIPISSSSGEEQCHAWSSLAEPTCSSDQAWPSRPSLRRETLLPGGFACGARSQHFGLGVVGCPGLFG